MVLSIITINYNNAQGLQKTLQSVYSQRCTAFEYIVIDGASVDESKKHIKEYADLFGDRMKWVSEPDNGIYNAMNKGIGMASGEYVQFLNSGDLLVSDDVVEKMFESLEKSGFPSILYGNMLKDMPSGTFMRDRCFAGREISLFGFYTGTLNHSPAYIKRSLFDKYGLYDESYKIVSDWKWYLQAIIFGGEKPVYSDIDVTLFDMNGISETNKDLDKNERRKVLEDLINPAVLADYDQWYVTILQMKRLKRHPWAYKLVWCLERFLFRLERHHNKRFPETQFS